MKTVNLYFKQLNIYASDGLFSDEMLTLNTVSSHYYLDKVFRNLLAVLRHSDWRDDPVSPHPDQSLALISPWVKGLGMQLFLTVV
uniref:Uncharacterized protein n=1 Tax=Monopterus albus TaxID=43700 RepID=A0A3Q3K511_MONAL